MESLLLNWLVQGTALTLLAAVGVGACRRLNAATRERIWWITLVAVLTIPLAGALPRPNSAMSTLIPSLVQEPPIAVPPLWPTSMVIASAAWATWMALQFARLGLALLGVFAAKRRAIPIAPDREARLTRWVQSRYTGRSTRLVLSERVHHAAVLGFRHPVIALAPATVSRLSDEELDQVVAHEYAHVQRRDDVAALVQRVISAIVGLHPAVWWLDRALIIEREVACDDWVVCRHETPKRYGACLVKLAAIARHRRRSMGPGLTLSRSELEIRISRLLDRRRNVSVRPSRPAIGAAVPAVACLALVCVALEIFGPPVGGLSVLFPPPRSVVARVESMRPGSDDVLNGMTTRISGSIEIQRPSPSSPAPSERVTLERPLSAENVGTAVTSAGIVVEHEQERVVPVEPEMVDVQAATDVLPVQPPSAAIALASTRVSAPEDSSAASDAGPGSPWGAVSAGGVAASQRTQAAAVGTARLFSRFGKSVGGAFRAAVTEPVQR